MPVQRGLRQPATAWQHGPTHRSVAHTWVLNGHGSSGSSVQTATVTAEAAASPTAATKAHSRGRGRAWATVHMEVGNQAIFPPAGLLRLPCRPLTLNLSVLAFMELHLHVSETTIHRARRGITHNLNKNTQQLNSTQHTRHGGTGGGTFTSPPPHSKHYHHHHPRAHSAVWTTPCSADAAGMPWRARVAIAITTVSTVVVLHWHHIAPTHIATTVPHPHRHSTPTPTPSHVTTRAAVSHCRPTPALAARPDTVTIPSVPVTPSHAAPTSTHTHTPDRRIRRPPVLNHVVEHTTERRLDAVCSIAGRDQLRVWHCVVGKRLQTLHGTGTHRHEARAEPTVACPAAGMLQLRLHRRRVRRGAVTVLTVRRNDDLEVMLHISNTQKHTA